MITFILDNRPNDNTGLPELSVVKKTDGKPDEVWCSINDLDQLFTACVDRWGGNWNLEKVKLAIRESDID